MFRFTIRDVLWLTVVVALGVAWGIDHRHGDNRHQVMNNRHQVTLAHAERLRDTLAKARRAYQIARDNYYLLNAEVKGNSFAPLPPGPDWSLADKPIPD